MSDYRRAIEYANPDTCWRYRHERTLEPLDWTMRDSEGRRYQLLPDGIVLIVGADMSVAIDMLPCSPSVKINAWASPYLPDDKVLHLAEGFGFGPAYVFPTKMIESLANRKPTILDAAAVVVEPMKPLEDR